MNQRVIAHETISSSEGNKQLVSLRDVQRWTCIVVALHFQIVTVWRSDSSLNRVRASASCQFSKALYDAVDTGLGKEDRAHAVWMANVWGISSCNLPIIRCTVKAGRVDTTPT